MSDLINATMRKFGWPATRIAELNHWAVMLRPQQCTLGALVLACKDPVRAFGDVTPEGFAELKGATAAIESMLQAAIGYDRINYLMLMMVDPDVHFHVIPRYEGARTQGGLTVRDAGWPGPPRLDSYEEPDADAAGELMAHLRAHWPQGPR